jgi:ribosomal protein S17E
VAHRQFEGPFKREFKGQFERNKRKFLMCFYSSIKVIIKAIYKWFYFQVPPVFNHSFNHNTNILTT